MPARARRLSPQDAPAMAALHETGFDKGWPEADMMSHISKDIALGIGAPLTGFIILQAAADQAEILTIITRTDMRGQGQGQALLSAGEQAAMALGVEVIFLEVAEDNEPAIALYRKCGYECIGRRPAYYRRETGRMAALTFRKLLDGPAASR